MSSKIGPELTDDCLAGFLGELGPGVGGLAGAVARAEAGTATELAGVEAPALPLPLSWAFGAPAVEGTPRLEPGAGAVAAVVVVLAGAVEGVVLPLVETAFPFPLSLLRLTKAPGDPMSL